MLTKKYASFLILIVMFLVGFSVSIINAQIVDDTVDSEVEIPKIDINSREDNIITLEISDEILQSKHFDSLPFEIAIVPNECFTNKQKFKEDIVNETLCENAVRFAVNDYGSYDFSTLKDSIIIIYTCKDKVNGCDTNPQKIKIGYISKKPLKEKDNQKGRFNILDLK